MSSFAQQASHQESIDLPYNKIVTSTIELLVQELVRLKTTTSGSAPSAFASRFSTKLDNMHKLFLKNEESQDTKEVISKLLEPLLITQKSSNQVAPKFELLTMKRANTFTEALATKTIGDLKSSCDSKLNKLDNSKPTTYQKITESLDQSLPNMIRRQS